MSLSGFHGNNLSLYMLAIKMLCSMTYVCYSTNRVFFVELYESNVTQTSSLFFSPHSPDRTLFLNLVACHRCFFRFTVLLLYIDNKRHSLLSKNGSYYLFYTTLYLNGYFARQMLTVLFVFISSSCPGSEDVNSRDQGVKVRSASGRALLKCS